MTDARTVRPIDLGSMIIPVWAHRDHAAEIALGSFLPDGERGGDTIDPTQIYGRVAVIPVVGYLDSSPSYARRWYGRKDPTIGEIEAAVRRAAADRAIEKILIYVNSPGGGSEGIYDLADAVYAARQEKEVVGFVEETGCSAAYCVVSQTSQIVCNKSAYLGSCGAYAVLIDTSKLDEEWGIRIEVVSTAELKGAHARSEITDAYRADVQRLINDEAELFFAAIMRGRGWTEKEMKPFLDARVHIGANAVALGLADRVMLLADFLGEWMD